MSPQGAAVYTLRSAQLNTFALSLQHPVSHQLQSELKSYFWNLSTKAILLFLLDDIIYQEQLLSTSVMLHGRLHCYGNQALFEYPATCALAVLGCSGKCNWSPSS